MSFVFLSQFSATTNRTTSDELSMSATSAAGPDGYSGMFFHSCWDIIQNDIKNYVQDFFRGKNLSKFCLHTCLILITYSDENFTPSA